MGRSVMFWITPESLVWVKTPEGNARTHTHTFFFRYNHSIKLERNELQQLSFD